MLPNAVTVSCLADALVEHGRCDEALSLLNAAACDAVLRATSSPAEPADPAGLAEPVEPSAVAASTASGRSDTVHGERSRRWPERVQVLGPLDVSFFNAALKALRAAGEQRLAAALFEAMTRSSAVAGQPFVVYTPTVSTAKRQHQEAIRFILQAARGVGIDEVSSIFQFFRETLR